LAEHQDRHVEAAADERWRELLYLAWPLRQARDRAWAPIVAGGWRDLVRQRCDVEVVLKLTHVRWRKLIAVVAEAIQDIATVGTFWPLTGTAAYGVTADDVRELHDRMAGRELRVAASPREARVRSHGAIDLPSERAGGRAVYVSENGAVLYADAANGTITIEEPTSATEMCLRRGDMRSFICAWLDENPLVTGSEDRPFLCGGKEAKILSAALFMVCLGPNDARTRAFAARHELAFARVNHLVRRTMEATWASITHADWNEVVRLRLLTSMTIPLDDNARWLLRQAVAACLVDKTIACEFQCVPGTGGYGIVDADLHRLVRALADGRRGETSRSYDVPTRTAALQSHLAGWRCEHGDGTRPCDHDRVRQVVTAKERGDVLGCEQCGQLRFADASHHVPAWQGFESARPFDADTIARLAQDAELVRWQDGCITCSYAPHGNVSLRALALALIRVVDRTFDVDLTTSRDVARDPHGPDTGTGRTIRVFGDDKRGLIETNAFEMHSESGEACREVIVISTYGARDLELELRYVGPELKFASGTLCVGAWTSAGGLHAVLDAARRLIAADEDQIRRRQ
jgi:hypothetical protein